MGCEVLLWGFAPRMGHKIEYWVEDHKVAWLSLIDNSYPNPKLPH